MLDNDLDKSDVKIVYLNRYSGSRQLNEVFTVQNNGEIKFLHKQNLIKFIYSNKCQINSLININIKNQKTYEVIRVIEILQKKFLRSNDLKDLKKITHDDILKLHKILFNSFLSKPIISLILNNTNYRDRDNSVFKLSYLTPKNHFINYIKIKLILSKYPYSTDKFIKEELKKQYCVNISTVQVFKIRTKYFIPNRFERYVSNNYKRFELYFSKIEFLNNDNICNFYNTSAVYELISISKVDYNYSQSTTIYIGSTKNLYKRLNEYKNNKGHSLKMRNYLEDNLLYFRFIKTDNYQHLETVLLHEFISFYGEMPLLNINNSKK
ncbi:GIY-YIG nuclease family protein [Halarcobacter sp.]|uniref:GIY-YIG nuclease family protein n=1 Tax=Halarcobacter sp. TaxID=2321133 RepID=UPI002AAB5C33|nr:GIY-YIG nuclease family protein [Halarcobacter sp.]